MNEKFNTLPLKPELLKNLEELKFHQMTPIQAKSLPVILEGRDVIAQAKTGSGKTAAFGLGILNSLNMRDSYPKCLILCPTRELAEQVAKEIRTLARMSKNTKVLTICGGTSEYHQERSLSHGAHIVVGTPGRIQSFLKKGILNLDRAETLVLDEADRMLDMGFYDEMMNIISYLPEDRQSLLFSATYPEEIRELGESFQNDAVEVKVDTMHVESSIDEIFYEVQGHQEKNDALLKILSKYRPDRLIIFCKTKRITDDVAKFLVKQGIYAAGIHGDLEQNERTEIMTKFSNRSLSILVATDVAARGLDISDLAAVVNYDLPTDPEIYVHRIGRTGRAGQKGMAFSLFLNNKGYILDDIEDYTVKNCKCEEISDIEIEQTYDLTPPMQTIYISGGKRDKLRPGDLLGAIVGEAKVDSSNVGNISIFNVLSYVAIKREVVDQVVEKLRDGRIKKKKFKVGFA